MKIYSHITKKPGDSQLDNLVVPLGAESAIKDNNQVIYSTNNGSFDFNTLLPYAAVIGLVYTFYCCTKC